MTVRRLALVVLAIAVVGSLTVAALGVRAVSVASSTAAATEAALTLRHRLNALFAAIDYAMLIDPDPALVAAVGADARALAGDAAAVVHHGARPLQSHLLEIANVADELGRGLDGGPSMDVALREVVEFQFRIHTTGADAALDATFDALADDAQRELRNAYVVTLVVALAFASLASAAALGAYGRIERGLRPLQLGVRRIARGDLATRVGGHGHDEFGQLGAAFDAMAERLERGAVELREREARFRLVAEMTADTVWEIDVERDLAWWHDGQSRLLGPLGEGEVPLAALEARAPAHVAAAVRALASDATPDGGVLRGLEHELVRPDGQVAIVVTSARLVRDDAGRPQRVIGATRDVTVERAIDRRLERAERLEALGHLTGGVAHDFNNMLTVILANAETLVEGTPEGTHRRTAATLILDAAQRGADLTRRLLTFARERPSAPQRVDLSAAVLRSAELLRRSVGEAIEVTFDLPATSAPVLLDATQFESALLNLALNARDAMPNGGSLRVSVATTRLGLEDGVDRPGRYVTVVVADQGSGIAPEHLTRVFEPFFTTKAPGQGTGLGLPMVYGMVTQARGHVSIDSAPGRGTRVTLAFPAASRADDAAPRAEPTAAVPRRGDGATVLVVEDDPLVRSSVVATITALGYRTIEAARASEALERLEEHPEVDVLFTDVVMPGGMDGAALARTVRTRASTLPIVFTSGFTMGVDVDFPGTTMLRKPYRPADLANALADALASAQRPDGSTG